MVRWLHNKFWREHTPECMECKWNMKPYKDSIFRIEWKCIWKSCGWGTFQTANGTLHWYKKKN